MKKLFFLFSFLFSLILGQLAFAENLIPKDSLYNLKTSWASTLGKEIKLAEFSGKKVLITMVYTSCPHACPMTISKIQEIEDASKNKDFKVVLVTFDPQKDTPTSNIEYLKKKKLNLDKFVLLTGPSEAAGRELAIILGINYKSVGNGDFAHSNIISVLDKTGKVVATLDGFEASIDPVVKALND